MGVVPMRLIYLLMAVAMLGLPAQAHHNKSTAKKAEMTEEAPVNVAFDHNVYRFGGTYDVRPVQSPEACASACNGTSECQAWNFIQSTPTVDAYCELKRGVGRTEPNPIAISGLSTSLSDQFQTLPKSDGLAGGQYTTVTTTSRQYTPASTYRSATPAKTYRSATPSTTYQAATPTTTRTVAPTTRTVTPTTRSATRTPTTTRSYSTTTTPTVTRSAAPSTASTSTVTRTATPTTTRTVAPTVTRSVTPSTTTTSTVTRTTQPTKVTSSPRSTTTTVKQAAPTTTATSTSPYYRGRSQEIDRVITSDEYYPNGSTEFPEYSVQNPKELESDVIGSGS